MAKKALRKKKPVRAQKTAAVKRPKREAAKKAALPRPAVATSAKATPVYQEVLIENAKFSHPQATITQRRDSRELPSAYNQDRMVLQVRDTRWLHCYWEVAPDTWERLRRELGPEVERAKRVLRVYDVSHIIFNGRNAHRHFDIEVGSYADNWYIDTNGPGRSWCVDYGLRLSSGKFITILRSNVVHTPLDGPSWITDEEWMIPDDLFARLYGMGFGLGKSSPLGKAWREKMALVSSPGIASMASPVKKRPAERKFWLAVVCELIVYGATEPDAKLTVQGKEVKLRPDGSFTLRFALPNGKQVIPVKARSADHQDERTITPIVNRETK
jgi:hypothetical protein